MTVKITLQRVTFANDSPVYGVLLSHNIPLCLTLELPWLENKPEISCIPPGLYPCARHESQKFGRVWMLQNVPARSAILIHAGNTIKDTQGCILAGRSFFGGGISTSKVTITQLHDILPDEFDLEILNPKEKKTCP
jgi:hypothetical protein